MMFGFPVLYPLYRILRMIEGPAPRFGALSVGGGAKGLRNLHDSFRLKPLFEPFTGYAGQTFCREPKCCIFM